MLEGGGGKGAFEFVSSAAARHEDPKGEVETGKKRKEEGGGADVIEGKKKAAHSIRRPVTCIRADRREEKKERGRGGGPAVFLHVSFRKGRKEASAPAARDRLKPKGERQEKEKGGERAPALPLI